jgi:hypothetical protein
MTEHIESGFGTVYNNSDESWDTIKGLKLIGKTVNKWRGRNINLFEHPTNPDNVIAVGTTFDGKMTVVTDDPRHDWFQHGL